LLYLPEHHRLQQVKRFTAARPVNAGFGIYLVYQRRLYAPPFIDSAVFF
jgi:hypothetical protein